MSWEDGYECYSTSDIDQIADSSEANHPMLIVLAHDGDNAFGGGYTYYEQCVSGLVDEAEGKVAKHLTSCYYSVLLIFFLLAGVCCNHYPAVSESVPS